MMEKWLGVPSVEFYKGLNLRELPLNHAYITVNTTVDNVGVYAVKESCYTCPYKLQRYLKAGEAASWKVDTSVQYLWRILKSEQFSQVARTNRKGILCQMRPSFGEYGVYNLDIGRCLVTTEVEPVYSHMPLFLCLLALLIFYIFYGSITRCKKRWSQNDKGMLQINCDKTENRMRSLFYFRNLLMACLIFATTGGGGYPIFNNEWGGISMGEALFFAFAWSIGVNIPAVMSEECGRRTNWGVIRNVFKRSFILIFLGVAVDSTISCRYKQYYSLLWSPLQRLGTAYFIVATTYVLTVQKFEMKSKRTICKAIGNLVSLMWCWIFSGFLLAIIIILISTFASFNCLGNAPLAPQPDYSTSVPETTLNCNNDTSELANRIFVGEAKKIVDVTSYVGFSRGLMGIMSTVMYMMIGLKAGIIYLHYPKHSDRLKLWIFWATLFNLGGMIFAGISYPLNFNLWPISTIIFITSAALYLLAFVYLLLEVWNLGSVLISESRTSAALAVLVGHQLFSNSLPFKWDIQFRSHFIYLVQNFWIVFLWLVISRLLRNKLSFLI